MSIQVVLSITAEKDLEIHWINIKGVYLNGKITEKEHIYTCQPPGLGLVVLLERFATSKLSID